MKYVVEDAKDTGAIDENTVDQLIDAVDEIKKMIESILNNNNRQRQLGTITSHQEQFQSKIEDLKQNIVSLRVIKSEGNLTNISLWDCDSTTVELNTLLGSAFSDNVNIQLKKIEDFCNELSDVMNVENKNISTTESVKNCSFYQKLKKE